MPASSAASIIRCRLSLERVTGFSQITCLPALAQAVTIEACSEFGAQIDTASMSSRLSISL